MGLVRKRSTLGSLGAPQSYTRDRKFGSSDQSEFTVVAVDAYNGINEYLSECSGTDVRSVEDIIEFNIKNRGSEGAEPGDHPAFPSGQVGQRGNRTTVACLLFRVGQPGRVCQV